MKTHRFDTVSFVFGVLFAAMGSLFVTSSRPWIALLDTRWSWIPAAAAILIGVAIIARLVRSPDDGAPAMGGPEHEELVAAHDELGVEAPRFDDL